MQDMVGWRVPASRVPGLGSAYPGPRSARLEHGLRRPTCAPRFWGPLSAAHQFAASCCSPTTPGTRRSSRPYHALRRNTELVARSSPLRPDEPVGACVGVLRRPVCHPPLFRSSVERRPRVQCATIPAWRFGYRPSLRPFACHVAQSSSGYQRRERRADEQNSRPFSAPLHSRGVGKFAVDARVHGAPDSFSGDR